ncbi:hypothetical protein R3Q06_29035 [Rhodococcus erythropolis]|uniref:hypothetical protein n=1 Tax=Rhodococcus erythropolis TaxID=1833 RepID=UPI002949549C|nr:hypothetical protein [Rhodococcus erythropolis]MDV6277540.1 hypothetical protein [Rhodococcus erythropolis]
MSWTRTTVIRAGAGAILTATAISAGVYIAAAEDHTPSAAEAEAIKTAVADSLDAFYSTAASPGATETLTALTSGQLDQKYAAAETRLRTLMEGPPLERALYAMNQGRDAEKGIYRYVGGGARVLDWTSVTIDGDTAHAAGRDESWLDTAVRDQSGHYTVGRGDGHDEFTVDLKKKPDGSWIVTESISNRDPNDN